MQRSYWVEHKGKKIVFVDFANTDADGVNEAIAQAKAIIGRETPHSVLCLVETQGTKLSIAIGRAVTAFIQHNKPYIKMTTVVGTDRVQEVLLSSAIVLTKRTNLVVKRSRTEALAYLVAQ